MTELDGLTNADCLVLDPLDAATPRPLWEIAEQFVIAVVGDPPSSEHIAQLLAPALASLATHGLVEVRRFASWPAAWETGLPVAADRIAIESRWPRLWSHDATSRDVLAVNITESGHRWL